MNIIVVGSIIFAVVFGVFVGYVIRQRIAKKHVDTAEGQAEKLLAQAKVKAQDTLLDAKKKATEINKRCTPIFGKTRFLVLSCFGSVSVSPSRISNLS